MKILERMCRWQRISALLVIAREKRRDNVIGAAKCASQSRSKRSAHDEATDASFSLLKKRTLLTAEKFPGEPQRGKKGGGRTINSTSNTRFFDRRTKRERGEKGDVLSAALRGRGGEAQSLIPPKETALSKRRKYGDSIQSTMRKRGVQRKKRGILFRHCQKGEITLKKRSKRGSIS